MARQVEYDDTVTDEEDLDSDTDTDSDSDTDSDTDDEEYYQNKTKFLIVLCEHYNKKIHGSPKEREGDYLVICKYNNLDLKKIEETSKAYNLNYRKNLRQIAPHSYIRNYAEIVTKKNYVKPEIAQCFQLPSGACVCILKTFWLRLVQRAWKRVYQQRKEMIRKRMNPLLLLKRVQSDKRSEWNKTLPGIVGMFWKN